MVILALAAPAAASGGFLCEGPDITASIATGRLPVLHVLGARITLGEQAWSTGPERGEGTPIVTGQAYGDGEQVLLDFTDPNLETILLGLRLNFIDVDGGDRVLSGVLIHNGVARDIRCGEG